MCIHNLKIGKVLVVDDTDDIREMLERLLIARGYQVVSTSSGDQALEEIAKALAAKEPYDAILLDYAMPTMDGLTCAIKIRENEASNHIPRVKIGFITGYADLHLSNGVLRDLDARETDKVSAVEKINNLDEWLAEDCPLPCPV